MLAEALSWLLTPASGTARRMGHLGETVAIGARHRRCRQAWAPHLSASKRALLASADAATRRRTALVVGSGLLLDVPLAEVARLFEAVWLVDLVHPWSSRLQARRYPNVRLIEHDVTESLAGLPREPALPGRFLDQDGIDWVASVNLLSQLPVQPTRWLRDHGRGRSEADLERIGEQLMRNHLAWLCRFQAPVCLLADLEQITLNADGHVLERRDFSTLLEGWQIQADWRWDLAPPGELGDGTSAYHRVAALTRHRG
jgi:hypothetical protein